MTANHGALRASLLNLTASQQIAAEALANGSTHAVAAEAANVARETVTRWAGHHPAFRAALNLRRATLAAEQSDAARRIRGRALAVVEAQLETADLPTALAILRAVAAPSPETIGPTEPAAALDAETRRTRVNLPPAAPVRDASGFRDPLADMLAPTEDERAEQLTVARLADAAGRTGAETHDRA